MYVVYFDDTIDALGIEFEPGLVGYSEELDENRIIDFSSNPGHPIGISLHGISKGVTLEGLPQAEKVSKILKGFGIQVL